MQPWVPNPGNAPVYFRFEVEFAVSRVCTVPSGRQLLADQASQHVGGKLLNGLLIASVE